MPVWHFSVDPANGDRGNMVPPTHRKTVRHFDEPGHVHELTFSCYQRLPLLMDDSRRKLFCQAVTAATERHAYSLFAFVIMPEHVHLIVHPGPEAGKISELLNAIKRPFSFRVKKALQESGDDELLARLTIRQRPGVETFRFWQEGPGYDRNLTEPKTIELAIDYVHANPVRRGLCLRAIDWKWSSARYHLLSKDDVDSDPPRLSPIPPELLH